MYKKHKIISIIIFLGTGLISFLINVEFNSITNDILTVMSIILGFYIAALSSLFGNLTLKEMSKKIDKKITNKTELGVLLSYYKTSIIVSFIVILLSLCLMMLNGNWEKTKIKEIINCLGATTIGFTFVSLFLMFILLMLFINILLKTNKRK